MSNDTVGTLAALVGGAVEGDASRPIRGVADLRQAGPQDIGFFNDAKLLDAARTTKAGALLVKRPLDTRAVQVVVDDVYAAFAKVASHFHPVPRATAHSIHPTAFVDAGTSLESPVQVGPRAVVEGGTRIGAGTVLAAGVMVGRDCRIGRDCLLHPGVVLYPGTELHDRVIIHGGCVLGSDGFGYAREANGKYIKFPQLGNVVIEDDVEIGANTTIDRGALGSTRIGRGSKLDNLIQVGHNCRFGEDVAIAGFCGFSGSTVLGDRVAIAGHVVSSGHLEVAADVRVGGNSTIYRDIEEAGDYLGYPLQDKRRWMRSLRAIDHILELQEEVRRLRKKVDGE